MAFDEGVDEGVKVRIALAVALWIGVISALSQLN